MTNLRGVFAEASVVLVTSAKRGSCVRVNKNEPRIKATNMGLVRLLDVRFLIIFIFYLCIED